MTHEGRRYSVAVIRNGSPLASAAGRLDEQAQSTARELATLLKVSHNIVSTLDLQPLLALILDQLRTVVDYSAAAVFVLDGPDMLHLLHYAGPLSQDEIHRHWSLNETHHTAEVIRTGRPIVIPDVHADTRLARVFRQVAINQLGEVPAYIGSYMAVPLIARDRVIGLLSFDHGQVNYYSEHYANLALAFGNQAAIAIENARLYGEAQEQARKTAALAEIAGSIALVGSLDEILNGLAERVVRATGSEACAVLLVDPTANRVTYAGSYGLPPGYQEADQAAARNVPDEGIGMRVLESQQPVIRTGIREAVLALPEYAPLHPFMREVEWDTIISVPLTYREQPLGTLTTFLRPEQTPSDEAVAFLSAIANQAAVAVENVRLFEEVQGKAALEERQKLARELHDSVSQALYGIALGARTARMQLDRDPAKASGPIDYVLSLAEAGMAEMRALIFELRPESLQAEGLVAALSKQAASLRARHHLEVTTALDPEPEVRFEIKEALYRIAQEALHNTVKHARATHVDLRLRESGGWIEVEVGDNGIGFDPGGSFPGHLGLQSMRERAARLGGSVRHDSAPGQGTRLCARIPAVPPHDS